MFYIFAPKINKEVIGHKNSRQVKFTFSTKAERATLQTLWRVYGLQIYGFLPDYLTKVLEN